MAVQILGGLAKGHKVEVPSGNSIRPTSVILRRKCFDWLQNLSGYIWLEVCSGSGSMGLEAWSRGADKVVLNELNSKTFQVLKKNVGVFKSRFSEETKERPLKISKSEGVKWFFEIISSIFESSSDEQELHIFLDPPYKEHKVYSRFFNKLKDLDCSREVHLWVESDSKKGLTLSELENFGFKPYKTFSHGDSFIAIIRLSDHDWS